MGVSKGQKRPQAMYEPRFRRLQGSKLDMKSVGEHHEIALMGGVNNALDSEPDKPAVSGHKFIDRNLASL
jgi:hypothetical protein